MVDDFDFVLFVADLGRTVDDLADFGRSVRFLGEGPIRALPAVNGLPD